MLTNLPTGRNLSWNEESCPAGGRYQNALPRLWQPPIELPIITVAGLMIQKPVGGSK